MLSFKKMAAVLAAAVLTVSLAGCHVVQYVQQEVIGFDSAGYVQAVLDCQYKAKYDDYKRLTNSTDQEAAEAYESGMEAESQTFAHYFNVTLDDDSSAKVMDMYKKLYQKAQYTVGEAVRQKDAASDKYTVEVRIKPMKIFDDITEDYAAFWQEFSARYTNEVLMEMKAGDLQKYYNAYTDGVLELLNQHIDSVSYGEEKTLTVHIQQDKDGLYEIDEDDFQEIDLAIIAY
ncbi:MAG: hypothetical protein HFJ80_03055 [Clostridiales bacterium]|nr:hypothetical protein [Clostridiales bacterium]